MRFSFAEDQLTNVQLEQSKSRKGKRPLACGMWNSIYVKESSEMYLSGVQDFDFNNTTHIIPLLLLHAPVNKGYTCSGNKELCFLQALPNAFLIQSAR